MTSVLNNRMSCTRSIRDACALLNKICPENKERIIGLFIRLHIGSVGFLIVLIDMIVTSTMKHPQFCPVYADLIHALNKACPRFPPEYEGAPQTTCRQLVLDALKGKFSDLMRFVEGDASKSDTNRESDIFLQGPCPTKTAKHNALAIMKFTGCLLIRDFAQAIELLPRTCQRMICDLLYIPSEFMVECALALIAAIGNQFPSINTNIAAQCPLHRHISQQFAMVLDRLDTCRMLTTKDGETLLSKRVQLLIEDFKDGRGKTDMHLEAVVLIAVQRDGDSLQYASKDMRNKENIVLAAVKQKCSSIQYASKEIQNRTGDIVRKWQCTILQAVRSMNESIVICIVCALDPGDARPMMAITCRSMGGNEIATISVDPNSSTMGICRQISRALGIPPPVLQIIIGNTRLGDAGPDEPFHELLKRAM